MREGHNKRSQNDTHPGHMDLEVLAEFISQHGYLVHPVDEKDGDYLFFLNESDARRTQAELNRNLHHAAASLITDYSSKGVYILRMTPDAVYSLKPDYARFRTVDKKYHGGDPNAIIGAFKSSTPRDKSGPAGVSEPAHASPPPVAGTVRKPHSEFATRVRQLLAEACGNNKPFPNRAAFDEMLYAMYRQFKALDTTREVYVYTGKMPSLDDIESEGLSPRQALIAGVMLGLSKNELNIFRQTARNHFAQVCNTHMQYPEPDLKKDEGKLYQAMKAYRKERAAPVAAIPPAPPKATLPAEASPALPPELAQDKVIAVAAEARPQNTAVAVPVPTPTPLPDKVETIVAAPIPIPTSEHSAVPTPATAPAQHAPNEATAAATGRDTPVPVSADDYVNVAARALSALNPYSSDKAAEIASDLFRTLVAMSPYVKERNFLSELSKAFDGKISKDTLKDYYAGVRLVKDNTLIEKGISADQWKKFGVSEAQCQQAMYCMLGIPFAPTEKPAPELMKYARAHPEVTSKEILHMARLLTGKTAEVYYSDVLKLDAQDVQSLWQIYGKMHNAPKIAHVEQAGLAMGIADKEDMITWRQLTYNIPRSVAPYPLDECFSANNEHSVDTQTRDRQGRAEAISKFFTFIRTRHGFSNLMDLARHIASSTVTDANSDPIDGEKLGQRMHALNSTGSRSRVLSAEYAEAIANFAYYDNPDARGKCIEFLGSAEKYHMTSEEHGQAIKQGWGKQTGRKR